MAHMTKDQQIALERARHALVFLTGLTCFDASAPEKTWEINETWTIAELDRALEGLPKIPIPPLK